MTLCGSALLLGYSEGTILLAIVTNARTVRAGRVAD